MTRGQSMCLACMESLGSNSTQEQKKTTKKNKDDTRAVPLGLAESKWPLVKLELDWQEALQVPP